jgi:hypothetical protein
VSPCHHGTARRRVADGGSDLQVKLSLCLIDKALRHEDVWGTGCIDPGILDLGTSWGEQLRIYCIFSQGQPARGGGAGWVWD